MSIVMEILFYSFLVKTELFKLLVSIVLYSTYISISFFGPRGNMILSKVGSLSELNKRRLIAIVLGLWQMWMYIVAFFFLSNANATFMIYKNLFFNGKYLLKTLKNFYLLSSLITTFLDFPFTFGIVWLGYYCNTQLRLDTVEFKY
jgi:hypothetical protein